MVLREKTKTIKVGDITIGGCNKVVVQSMCDIKTSNVEKVIEQINRCAELGAQMMRVSVFDYEDARAIKDIKAGISIPLVADIHNNHKLGIEAIKSGADKIRINPGNIGNDANLFELLDLAKKYNVPIRIGVNLGSLEKDIEEEPIPNHKKLVKSALRYIKKFEKHGFDQIVVSVKASDPLTTLKAYRLLAKKTKYPLHIGVTESGYDEVGIIRSVSILSPLLLDGIGDTMRISLTQNPEKEVKTCLSLLHDIGLKEDYPTIISCPTCGRTMVNNLAEIAKQVHDHLLETGKNIKVAVMGCAVNGIGEGRHADIGIAGGDGTFVIFVKRKIVKTVNEKNVLRELFEIIDQY